MRLLFSARPAFGHVYPLLPLALAASAASHDVRFATTGPFLSKLAALGFPTDDVGIT
jgi:UDP:flavonoid glycosyltransferase YjiC (YdhE family)